MQVDVCSASNSTDTKNANELKESKEQPCERHERQAISLAEYTRRRAHKQPQPSADADSRIILSFMEYIQSATLNSNPPSNSLFVRT